MNLPIVLRDEAQAEFDDAFDWYDAKRAGLGLEFVAEVPRGTMFASPRCASAFFVTRWPMLAAPRGKEAA